MIGRRRRDIGLGSYPTVSLAKARQHATANRLAVTNGGDPLSEKKRASTPTFREAAEATLEFLVLTATLSGEARGGRWDVSRCLIGVGRS
ncbi:MAG: DUF4102 domain-containing protein [Gammaproteobacteria bacterium]|nr:DUF4102 domain-containing protein [Gammaproteobacteria bacterium]